MGGLTHRTDHHQSVIAAAQSPHPNDLASSDRGHPMAVPSKVTPPVTSNGSRKRNRYPANADSLVCQWLGCTYKRSFNRKQDLLRHLKTQHIFRDIYICPVEGCYKRHKRPDILKDHINTTDTLDPRSLLPDGQFVDNAPNGSNGAPCNDSSALFSSPLLYEDPSLPFEIGMHPLAQSQRQPTYRIPSFPVISSIGLQTVSECSGFLRENVQSGFDAWGR
ncbi:uncharacterized protein P174DRAFT_425695 [Aspergillus novofumigatus IBT 16806]|uniref:C2H2-type domain-containing protein n=1 Tax=Aspergillus novofumigatus (strain IBT 16806) TaxID=1392255 RepID=A0A2I1BTC7_ASPN1|nr:uncharacterized protein P174DRAFT_425695 [Aspergillus novofumigatus IBT 16806]PKX88667.1 hypothetical protein P174DRAFT_425695 [Aspergillus novofumigatus IBT 16806]